MSTGEVIEANLTRLPSVTVAYGKPDITKALTRCELLWLLFVARAATLARLNASFNNNWSAKDLANLADDLMPVGVSSIFGLSLSVLAALLAPAATIAWVALENLCEFFMIADDDVDEAAGKCGGRRLMSMTVRIMRNIGRRFVELATVAVAGGAAVGRRRVLINLLVRFEALLSSRWPAVVVPPLFAAEFTCEFRKRLLREVARANNARPAICIMPGGGIGKFGNEGTFGG